MRKFKIKRLVLAITIILIFACGGLLLSYYFSINKPLKVNGENISIEVEDGEAFNSLLDRLESEGILRSKTLIKVNLKLQKRDTTIIPGTYDINGDITLNELIKTLQTEDLTKNQVAVTIPEGFNIDEIAEVLEENGLFSKEEFISAIKEYEIPSYVKNNSMKKYNLEGYLYPDTYYFNKDVEPKQVIKTMNEEFNKIIEEISKETGKEIKEDDIERIITIASLIEEEAQLDEERRTVSSVIENRLEKGMKLEFCSTINYAWGEHIVDLRNRHLEIDSPYNTYKNSGLPVGPIANSGKESIIAAVNPEKTDYLYFVLLNNQGGKHHFSVTGEEHEKVKKEQGL
ncbi:endolytic transglycosylase MltG [Clostridium paraputrificum]|uniref:endolytic transglycosylase MltG n=1 Tax=Clostridium TaxID=1485 RepID=UPI003D351955